MKTPSTQRGLTLVELLVAMAVGLILIAGVITIFLGSKQSYRTSEALSRVQESGRFALEFMARDLRAAGYSPAREFGCTRLGQEAEQEVEPGDLHEGRLRVALTDPSAIGEGQTANPDATANWNAVFSPETVPSVYSEGEGTAPAGRLRGDWVTAQTFSPRGGPMRVLDSDTSSGLTLDVEIAPDAEPDTGETMVIIEENCTRGVVLELCGISEIAGGGGEEGETGGGDDDGPTATHRLSFADCNAGHIDSSNRNDFIKAHPMNFEDAGVLRVSGAAFPVTYYIGTGAGGEPALFRRAGTQAAQELVEGVENMRLLYSLRSAGNPRQADGNFVDASASSVAGNWENVVAVRVELLVRSAETNVVPEVQSVTFGGAPVNTDDRRLRQVFTSTIALRNRLL
ncbi:PilW family protein [Pseudothauera rhizosphaerae]|uniref:PilW family protein n=1 Tax=Pseudothauera rhizosphaerae TaxID=2565932 RepID=UPI001454DF12|nr:PilW family protein [Pseudothauera rhizosphaerae]